MNKKNIGLFFGVLLIMLLLLVVFKKNNIINPPNEIIDIKNVKTSNNIGSFLDIQNSNYKKALLEVQNSNYTDINGIIQKSDNRQNISSSKKPLNTGMKLESVLKDSLNFNRSILQINEEFNIVDVLMNEFKNVNSIDDFLNFQNLSGKFTMSMILLKLGDRQGFVKYFNFYIDIYNLQNDLSIEKKEKVLNDIVKSFKNNGYYNSDGLINNKGKDVLFIAIGKSSIDEKINKCIDIFEPGNSLNQCLDYVYVMNSTKKNNLCDKILLNSYHKKICKDLLK